MINRLANATRLGTRIYTGYGIVGALALALLVVASLSMLRIGGEFGNFSAASERYRDGLLISGGIADMQRAVQAYIFQGHASAAERVQALHEQLRASLERQGAGQQGEGRLAAAASHLETYYETFLQVQELRDLQATVLESGLPKASASLLASVRALAGSDSDPELGLRLANAALEAEASAYRYFDTLESTRVEETLAAIDRARRELAALRPESAEVAAALTELADYERRFLAAVQQSRGYTFLVNVVMAAEAYEMLYQARALAGSANANMADNEQAIGRVIPTALATLGGFGALLLLLILVLAWVIGESIAIPIRRMTATFQQLAAGAGDTPIPAYGSGDQISELSRAAAVFRDKNKETESLLIRFQALSESLEEQVAERTEALEASNEQLRVARDDAEAAARAKSEFLANMSHEIRTPVHALQGQLQLLENAGLSDEQREYARQAWISNKALSMLLNDILDFSKIDAGRMEFEAVPVNLYEVVEELEALFRDQATTKGLRFEAAVAPSVPEWVRGDATRITQVLLNLLSNAFKFTAEGQVALRASSEGKNDAGLSVLRFEVEDTGVGIPQEKLQAIFEEFTQAEGSTTRTYGGTGLGLSIARRLVVLMGGDLTVASEPGRGTCFTVVLPLLELSVEEMLAEAAPGVEDVDLSRNDALAGVCILLTEDNPSLQKMTRLLLEQQGATVVLANNGQEALDALRAGAEPDLVLMDMQMPVLGGVDATHAIRQRYSREELPVLAMTANATRQDRDAAAAVGMNDFLAKPLDFRRLVAALRRHLAFEPTGVGIRPAPAPGGLATGTFQDFDLAGALARMTGQVDIYRAAAEPFLAGYETQLAQLAEAVAAADNAAAAKLSHELKGSASLLGARALLAAAARAEVCFRDEAPGPAAAQALLAELRGACDNAVATLRDILADQDGPSGDQAQ
ncbi:ATP-binding protein [Pseudohaliea rubra]|uniref:histidine kinase n=1 Tax=Pseudohaliea rubra DSM 19751 TaxID=1265313 RepID=A0A095VP94_9GAMM|nr:ATP-binding protein [Pseudohaliea rubra]KGE03185.1 hypothetical protein HRUBRA_02225 [Pseudohaliea rubra DSM 19751]